MSPDKNGNNGSRGWDGGGIQPVVGDKIAIQMKYLFLLRWPDRKEGFCRSTRPEHPLHSPLSTARAGDQKGRPYPLPWPKDNWMSGFMSSLAVGREAAP